jgi:hypothetical protein
VKSHSRPPLVISIASDGEIRFIHDDALAPLLELGESSVSRASHVEPTPDGREWTADLSPVSGPVLGPFSLRADALAAERAWLEANYL